MIPEIQNVIKDHLPLIVEEAKCTSPSLYLRGNNWHFSAITSWRISQNNKFLFGSDGEEEEDNLAVDKILNNALITKVISQSTYFPVDPAFYINEIYLLEIFSDASYDTWTFKPPNQPVYDFLTEGMCFQEIQAPCFFSEFENLLPLLVQSISFENHKLHLLGSNWKLVVSSSWRFVDNNSSIFGCTEVRGKDLLKSLKKMYIHSIHSQSNHFPIDPVFNFSNGFRLELFSASCNDPWILYLPNGKISCIDNPLLKQG